MIPRTIGALALRPTGNAQGNFYFFSLSTGRVINRTHATALPMPDDVIERVHALARRQKANPGMLFTNRVNQPFVDDDIDDGEDDDASDESYVPHDDEGDESENENEYDNDTNYDEDDDQYDNDYDDEIPDDENDNENNKKNNERIILCPISLLDVNSRPRHCTLARADKLLSVGV
jgi:hypothetical protein